MNYKQEMAEAYKRLKLLDPSGTSEDKYPLNVRIGTVMIALATAIRNEDWQLVSEAQVLLERLHRLDAPAPIHRDFMEFLLEE
jgi:hypothetical protein